MDEDFFKQDMVYTLKFASHYCNVSQNTLRYMLISNHLNGVYKNKLWLIRKSQLYKLKQGA